MPNLSAYRADLDRRLARLAVRAEVAVLRDALNGHGDYIRVTVADPADLWAADGVAREVLGPAGLAAWVVGCQPAGAGPPSRDPTRVQTPRDV